MTEKLVIIFCVVILPLSTYGLALPSQSSSSQLNEIPTLKSLVAAGQKNLTLSLTPVAVEHGTDMVPCTCAVFLSGQFVKGSSEQPKGFPALLHEQDTQFPCTPAGNKQCQNKCLDSVVKHLPNSSAILCGTIDRDCHKERAYLFIQNCSPTWINTNLSAGREFCCKDGLPYKCPLI